VSEEGVVENTKARKAAALRTGLQAFGGLMALTMFEFWIASMAEGPIPYPVLFWPLAPVTWLALSASANPIPYLVLAAAIKAVLILRFFMHVSQVWQGEGGH
jgi:hypothetical protein